MKTNKKPLNLSQVVSYDSLAENLNTYTFNDYYQRLQLLARSVFEWDNLPNGIEERFIERVLYSEGKAVFYEDKNMGLVVAKVNESGPLNHYDNPTWVRPYATGFQLDQEAIDYDDCVIIRNNDMMLPTNDTIMLYAMRLTEIQRSMDVNVIAQKTPILIQCSDKQLTTLKRIYEQYTGNEPVIFGDEMLDLTGINCINTNAPFVADKLCDLKDRIWNEAMTFLGLNNANTQKKERLITDEANANNQLIMASANVMLKNRELACEMINKQFNCNISVKLRNFEEFDEPAMEDEGDDIDDQS